MTRFLALAAVSATAWGQFGSLATPSDGSAVYFTTALRLKGAYESPWGKVFAADERGVRLVAGRELRAPALPDHYSGNCILGPLISFRQVDLSADAKSLAARGSRWTAGQCHGAGAATLLRTASGSRDVNGVLRLSANGRWAIVDTTPTVYTQTTGYLVDLTTGARTEFQFPSLGGVQFPSGRAIADDGTALFSNFGKTYLLRPGGAPVSIDAGFPVAISATGTQILYVTDAAHLLDLTTQRDQQLGPGFAGLSGDGSRAVFVENGMVSVTDLGGGARQVATVPEGVSSAVLSGNGKVLYAVTGTGRLVKITVDTGVTTEIVGRTIDIVTPTSVDAGMFTTISGRGFAEQSFSASAPLPLTLGGVSVSVGGRLVPVSRVTPTAIDILVPWDMSGSALPVVVETPSTNTPFGPPQATLATGRAPRAGALYREDWTLVSNLTVHTAEVIHVLAVGLGGVLPEVAPGTAAPSSEPLARLASPMSCSNATVLYAGLQPGTVARVYQVDLQIGGTTGYQQFGCSLGGTAPFAFLTLNVSP